MFKDQKKLLYQQAISNEAQIEEVELSSKDSNTIEFILIGNDGVWKGVKANQEYDQKRQLANAGIIFDQPIDNEYLGRPLIKHLAESIRKYTKEASKDSMN